MMPSYISLYGCEDQSGRSQSTRPAESNSSHDKEEILCQHQTWIPSVTSGSSTGGIHRSITIKDKILLKELGDIRVPPTILDEWHIGRTGAVSPRKAARELGDWVSASYFIIGIERRRREV